MPLVPHSDAAAIDSCRRFVGENVTLRRGYPAFDFVSQAVRLIRRSLPKAAAHNIEQSARVVLIAATDGFPVGRLKNGRARPVRLTFIDRTTIDLGGLHVVVERTDLRRRIEVQQLGNGIETAE